MISIVVLYSARRLLNLFCTKAHMKSICFYYTCFIICVTDLTLTNQRRSHSHVTVTANDKLRKAKWACLVGTAGWGSSRAIDGGNNKLDIMRVPDTLFWAAFLIHKVRECSRWKLFLYVFFLHGTTGSFFFPDCVLGLTDQLVCMLWLLACRAHRGPWKHTRHSRFTSEINDGRLSLIHRDHCNIVQQ